MIRIKNISSIWYNDESNKKHRHYVDILYLRKINVLKLNLPEDLKRKKDNIFLKQHAAKLLGYKYEFLVYNRNE